MKQVARRLPAGEVGAKVEVYRVLQEIADEQRDLSRDADDAIAWFRKDDLARRAGVSPSHLPVVLGRLVERGFIAYTPGHPGRKSCVRFLPPAGSGD